MVRLLLLLCLLTPACVRPVQRGRTERFAPPTRAEEDAAARATTRRCSLRWGILFPGLGHVCNGQDAEAAVLGTLAAGEIGTAVAVGREQEADHPGVGIPLVALQDLWLIGSLDPYLDSHRAAQLLYVHQDSLVDLTVAPFNPCVLRKPEVWGGLAVMLALGIGVTIAVDGEPDTSRAGDDPNLFGRTVDRRWGYPLAGGIGVGMFSHVAVAEELTFRGWAQSAMARSQGQTQGWISASLLFGAVHALNIFALPSEERTDYLMYGVPFITALGSYLGWVYRQQDYGLAAPVAIHFWYDLLLSATFFAIDPTSSPLSASMAIHF